MNRAVTDSGIVILLHKGSNHCIPVWTKVYLVELCPGAVVLWSALCNMVPRLFKQSTRLHGFKGDLLFCGGAWRHWLSGSGCSILQAHWEVVARMSLTTHTAVCSSASAVDLRHRVIPETKHERWMCVGSKVHMGGQAAGLSIQQSASILRNRTYIFMHPKVG